jgi:hypothetical protein
MGRRINDYRLKLVNRFTSGLVVDIGIGSGQFVESRNALGFNTLGIDVNPRGIEWLQEKKWEATLDNPVPVLTFWDSLEHVKDFKPLLKKAQKFVFVCIPIFTDYKSVFVSKHFRKTEHFHYFNHMGFVSTFWNEGFRLIEYSDAEQELGREGVRTYVFKRA